MLWPTGRPFGRPPADGRGNHGRNSWQVNTELPQCHARLGISAAGNALGLAHQMASPDRPPLPAMVLEGAFALAAVAALWGLHRRARWGRLVGLVSRAGDLLLLVGALLGGGFAGEAASHVIPAAGQFLLCLVALVFLLRLGRRGQGGADDAAAAPTRPTVTSNAELGPLPPGAPHCLGQHLRRPRRDEPRSGPSEQSGRHMRR